MTEAKSETGEMLPKRMGYGLWLFVFSVAANLLLLAVPLYLSQIYDRVLPSNSLDTLLYLSLLMLFCLALFGILEILRNNVAQKMSVHYELRAAPLLLRHAVEVRSVMAPQQASMLGDVSNVRQILSSRAFIGLYDLPFAPLFLAILFVVHPWLGWLATLGAVALVLIAVANEMLAQGKQEKAQQLYGQSNAKSTEILRRLDDVCAMGMGSNMRGRWQEVALKAAASSNEVSSVNGFFYGLVRFARQAIQIGILGAGAYLVLVENLSAGLIFAASIVSGRALMPIEQVIGGWRQLAAARAAHKRIKTQLVKQDQQQQTQGKQTKLPEVKGHLSCEGVTLVPQGKSVDKALLRGLTFKAEPGEVVAVIGASGAGKTTLMRLLANIVKPSVGKLLYDGFEAQQWDREQLGPHIGYAGQDSEFFTGSVAENIARFTPDATDDEIVTAAQNAGAHEFIGSLPEGYNTMLDGVSVRLSGGQKQRISLARAFFRDPAILLLDEPDAHLDQAGELALRAAIDGARKRGKTILFVTQRMHLVTCADKVMVLENGCVSKFGPREEVFKPRSQAKAPGKQGANFAAKGKLGHNNLVSVTSQKAGKKTGPSRSDQKS